MENIILIIIFLIISIVFIKNKGYNKLLLLFKLSSNLDDNNKYYDFNLIGKYFNNLIQYKKFNHIITDKMVNDFDLNSVFKIIDKTTSKIGQQFLYSKIRTISTLNELIKFDKFIQVFEKDNSLSKRCKNKLTKLRNENSYYLEELIHNVDIDKPKWLNLIYILTFFFVIILLISFFVPSFFILLIPIYIINIFFHYKNKAIVSSYLTAVSEFSKSINIVKKLSKENEIINHFKDFGFINKVVKIHNKAKFISFEKQMNDDFLSGIWGIFELFKIAFNFEIIIFYKFIDDITEEKENINMLFSFIGELDAAISVSELRQENKNICKPYFLNKKIINIKNIIHPLINDCVPNDLILNNKSILLTGSNMSGKTTFIRAVSINSILAQTIYTCFAEKFEAPFMKIFSSIRISDNIFENTSYYLEEVLTIKEFIEFSTQNEACLFVLDEIFKGTNTVERISAGNAILNYLNKSNHFVFVSTHDIELTELLEKNNFELYHFQEQILSDKLFFDHKLKKGSLKTRNAIKILELYNYPLKIIVNANNTVKLLTQNMKST